jgi:hypothetical protein
VIATITPPSMLPSTPTVETDLREAAE